MTCMLLMACITTLHPTYLCELISRKESSVHARLGADHHELIMPPISKDGSNTFLDVHLFLLLHANGTD